ncbi:MAG: hypothetical protein S4CHLAM45_07570 [Chlamydiales bacterium]|nr:hypothetical protein [Chlamydiales bacterium]MCH9620033.1 hypothetical protein [Chlamydiales bacterium]MCH9622864.1 hypothetical protein [Chlamydiales bacterium]
MTILYFIMAGLALGILVFFHELGHYFVAKKTGMTVEVFSIGFGRPILKWRWQNVDWQVGWLPFGGYVKILGMEVSKKDNREPYEIPNGFFAQAPIKRIAVAGAGPLANFILALLIFTAIWAMGGREKPFNEYTQIIGYVEPESQAYEAGIRPGDQLTEYNGKPFTNSKDLLYAAMLGGEEVELKGFHIDYATKDKTPFFYTINTYPAPGVIEDIQTTGITSMGSYLIYDQIPGAEPNPLPEGSPMEGSGLEYGDRLIWADGELLFSMDQLSALMNDNFALLTVKRGEETFLTRQPRVLAGDMSLPRYLGDELSDWQYEVGLKGRWQDLSILPFVINSEGYVERPLRFIDTQTFSHSKVPLEAGDRIIAVDGITVSKGFEILNLLQAHHLQLIVQKGVSAFKKGSWKTEDALFDESIKYNQIHSIATTIGTEKPLEQFDEYQLLKPVEPIKLDQFSLSAEARERMKLEMLKQQEQVLTIKDREKRDAALAYLAQSREKRLLGLYLQDRKVDFNPNPFALFGQVFVETWQTLKALVMGYLHPKWLSGPIGIVRVIHHGWRTGIAEALFWIGAISVNLGFLNLLPIPVLDGGYICLSLWELITRRRLKAKTMERIVIPFVVLLIALLVFLTFQDISRLFSTLFLG